MSFRGTFYHNIDTKGRLSIPSGFRLELQRRSDRAPILTNHLECLHLYPHEDWIDLEDRLGAVASMDPNAQRLARWMISGAVDAAIDNQGRILIPPFLRERAQLGREVAILGVGKRMEIWNRERLDADLNGTEARFIEISTELAPKLGT
jgi:MraZ protein